MNSFHVFPHKGLECDRFSLLFIDILLYISWYLINQEYCVKAKIIKPLQILSIILSSITIANANPIRILCNGDTNYLYVIIDTEKKSVIAVRSYPHEYFSQPDFSFWFTTSPQKNQTLVRLFTLHKSSGKMTLKSDNMITSGEQIYYYKCAINHQIC